MSSKLISIKKLGNGWDCMLEVHENHAVYEERQVFLKKTKHVVLDILRHQCNCTIPKKLAR